MEKKNYIKPTSEIYVLKMEGHLLSESLNVEEEIVEEDELVY